MKFTMEDASEEPTEFGFTCTVCHHRESWTTELASEAAAELHLYDQHPVEWAEHFGGEPKLPPPATVGRKFEAWESQL
jgi:hypothetical protein